MWARTLVCACWCGFGLLGPTEAEAISLPPLDLPLGSSLGLLAPSLTKQRAGSVNRSAGRRLQVRHCAPIRVASRPGLARSTAAHPQITGVCVRACNRPPTQHTTAIGLGLGLLSPLSQPPIHSTGSVEPLSCAQQGLRRAAPPSWCLPSSKDARLWWVAHTTCPSSHTAHPPTLGRL